MKLIAFQAIIEQQNQDFSSFYMSSWSFFCAALFDKLKLRERERERERERGDKRVSLSRLGGRRRYFHFTWPSFQ